MSNLFCTKVHRSYRTVVAICDHDLIGKKFEQDKRQLDLRESFYKDKEMDDLSLKRMMKMQLLEDATFSIAGKNSIKIAIEEGIINKDCVGNIAGIPFALKLI